MTTPSDIKKSKVLPFMLDAKGSAPEIEKSLYEGPAATIIVGPADKSTTYIVPLALICHRSRFFDRALNGYFKESILNRVELPEDTVEEFELLLEWIYCKKVPWTSYIQGIEKIINFYLVADKFDVAGPFGKVDTNLRTILVDHWYAICIEYGTLAYGFLESVYQLPTGHEARRLFAKACVRPYLVYETLMKDPPYDNSLPTIRSNTSWLNVKAAFDTIDGFAMEVVKSLGETMVKGL
ncbi:hypothetical protein BOTCAL_0105g00280 [Botryotinia calthae]|uniref:BTB domain-containing protein n=1 Tax=Botryotinia calthae TaxID=38488 RepID=A0A4Y8D6B5_9HELO|nr:hypothetical protein BOTCAL_0105g00280 [Botryotinia calthae]